MGGKLARYAKILRRGSTEAEKLLWSKLKAKQLDGLKFRRQQPVGSFIVDFVCFEKRGLWLSSMADSTQRTPQEMLGATAF